MIRKKNVGLLYILPWLIGFFVLQLYPFLASIYYSFTDFSILKAPTFVGVENYKKLAARIEYKMEEHGSKMLVVTSVSENEGKSTVAANLAISFAQKGKRVILIDGDLKRPSQFLIFGLEMEDKSELGEFLKENADFKDVLKKIKNEGINYVG